MRILGGLRIGYKLKTFLPERFTGHTFGTCCVKFLCLFLIQSPSVYGSTQTLIIKSYGDLLRISKKESAEYQKIKEQFSVDNLTADNLTSMYNWTLSGGVNTEDAESPATSPFAPAGESERTNANLRLEKQTALGVTPYVELSTQDVAVNFPGNGSVSYQTASLETGFRLNLMKVLFGKHSLEGLKEKEYRQELASLAMANTDRDFSVKVLKAYFQYLKSYKRLEILRTQCSEYKNLYNISSRRYRRRLIREQDYLSIEVLYQNCILDKTSAENTLALDGVSLIKTAGLPSNTIVLLSGVDFPAGEKTLSFDMSKNLDYQITSKTLEASRAKTASTKAKKFPEFNLDYSLKSQASEDGVGESISEAFGFDLLTQNIGLNLKYEFGSSSSQIDAKKSIAETKIRSLDFEQLRRSLERDHKRIESQLAFLTTAKASSQSLTKLQSRKSRLFNKDFKNGRGGIRDLVEAQISYLNSLERALEYRYQHTVSKIDQYSLAGENLERFN